jgi:hypothetical protein
MPHDAQPAVLPGVRLSKPLRCRAFQSVKRALNLMCKGAQIGLACARGCRELVDLNSERRRQMPIKRRSDGVFKCDDWLRRYGCCLGLAALS